MKKIIICILIGMCIFLSGCTEEEVIDTDGDGVPDENDAFPEDMAASQDTDGDGYPDEWNANYNHTSGDRTNLSLDMFIEDPEEWNDLDGDGYGDNMDEVPNDPLYHKLTYIIEDTTETFTSGEDKTYDIRVTENFKKLFIYWRLDTSNIEAIESLSVRYSTPTTWAAPQHGVTGEIEKTIAEWGIWKLEIQHDGTSTGYNDPITVTYRVYAYE